MAEYDLVKIFKALADQTRQDILELLAEEEMNVTSICRAFQISQPTVSHHLKLLTESGLIRSRKESRHLQLFPNNPKIEQYLDLFGELVQYDS